ncbi:unnamed protein product [Nezara viridula]|uniref:Uncharacterized protein n=1 Tax=Nezara viridula TaxID=85310 RepID=A0A9P0HME4_NEZVI|nr:unnamed protein product [Nezara viridula]
MWSSCLYVSAFLLVAVYANPRKKASDYFAICHTSDSDFNDCVNNTLTTLRGEFIKGIPSLNLLPLEPLKIEKMELRQGTGEKFQMYQKLTNINIHGIGNYTIEHCNFDYKKKQWNHTQSYPYIKLEGDYEMDGKMLILPIKGNGKIRFLCTNVTTFSEVCFETFERNKEIYTRIKDYKLRIETKHAEVHLTNMFNGDRRLSEGVNRFLNSHWKEVFETYKELPEKSFAEFMKKQMNCIFTTFPEKELFPE